MAVYVVHVVFTEIVNPCMLSPPERCLTIKVISTHGSSAAVNIYIFFANISTIYI